MSEHGTEYIRTDSINNYWWRGGVNVPNAATGVSIGVSVPAHLSDS